MYPGSKYSWSDYGKLHEHTVILIVLVGHQRVRTIRHHCGIYNTYEVCDFDETRTHKPTHTATRYRALRRDKYPVRDVQ